MFKRNIDPNGPIFNRIGTARRGAAFRSFEGLATATALIAIFVAISMSGSPAEAQNIQRGMTIFQRCTACHSIERGKAGGIGPNLYGIVGRPVASRPKFTYSKALSAAGGVWSRERLDKFLESPSTMIPGTRMTAGGVTSEQDRRDLIAFLARTARRPNAPGKVLD